MVTINATTFTTIPLAKNVSAGERVVFQCQHETADGIGWKLNGTLLNTFNPANVTATGLPLPNGNVIYNLILTALPRYNNTTIECIATFLNQEAPTSTEPVLLLIQGMLISI